MAASLPVSLRVGTRPPGVIVDAAFALSPMGLAATMALSGSAEVWLPRGLHTLLDNDALYRRRPEQMGGAWLGDAGGAALLAAMAQELEPWRRAWQNGRLSSRVHWIGDAQYESALPDREQCGLLPRFERCCAAFDACCATPPAGPLDECARDVVALAGALQPERAFILTLAGGGAAPPLCGFLPGKIAPRRLCYGLPYGSDAAFGPALVPIAAGEAGAAIIQIVAPGILALPDGWSDDDWGLDEPAGSEDPPDDLWLGACALWRPLVPMEAAA